LKELVIQQTDTPESAEKNGERHFLEKEPVGPLENKIQNKGQAQ
jgi:hypothetical protein